MHKHVKFITSLASIVFFFGNMPYMIEILTGIRGLADLVDILFLLPSLSILFLLLFREFGGAENRYRYLFYLFLIVMIEGHGIHWAANMIHNSMLPGERGYDTAYFLDEILGHVIFFSGVYLSLLYITYLRLGMTCQLTPDDRLMILLSSLVVGYAFSLSTIEGQIIIPFLIIVGVTLGVMMLISRWKRWNVLDDAWTSFVVQMFIFFYIFSILYYITFGSFRQPSEIFNF